MALLAHNGGPFEMGAEVDLGSGTYCGYPPSVEDFEFVAKRCRNLGVYSPAKFWRLLQRICRPNLGAVFGEELKLERISRGLTCVTDENCGQVSLGCIAFKGQRELSIDRHDSIRLEFRDELLDRKLNVPVNDLRLYEADDKTPRHEIVHKIDRKLSQDTKAILSVGLTRAFSKDEEREPKKHWLQVNNIHFADDPLGRCFDWPPVSPL